MVDNIFSPHWYRVQHLKPSLMRHVQIHRQSYHDESYYLLEDNSQNRFHRYDLTTFFFIANMNGEHTVGELWHAANERFGDDAPVQDEVIELLSSLYRSDLIAMDTLPNFANVAKRQREHKRQEFKGKYLNPLSIRIPLINPDKLLNKMIKQLHWLFTPKMFALWAILVGLALILTGVHWSEITHDFSSRALSPSNVLLMWIIYPIMKIIHEFAHALMLKRKQCPVDEMGVLILVLMPFAYVDTTASWALKRKYDRILVSAAGIMVEVLLAAAALCVWLLIEDGLIKNICYNVMIIGGISTVVFNGNPLLRYDGYFILADLIEIPNLASRANVYTISLIKRRLFSIDNSQFAHLTAYERSWFIGYSIAAFCYRVLIFFVIVVMIGKSFPMLALIIGGWMLYMQYCKPLLKGIHQLMQSVEVYQKRRLIRFRLAVIASVTLVVGFLVPLPQYTTTQGVVWLSEDSIVRAQVSGFISAIYTPSRETVVNDQRLFELDNPNAITKATILEKKLREVRQQYYNAWSEDPFKKEIYRDEIEKIQTELNFAKEEVAKLSILAPIAGMMIIPHQQDLMGSYVKKGQVLGYIFTDATPTIRLVISQYRIGLIRRDIKRIVVKRVTDVGESYEASITRSFPEATTRLPSAALGTQGGGLIEIDPSDKDGLKAKNPVFQFELTPVQQATLPYIGSRVYVRFYHGYEPLAYQFYRNIRQLLMRNLVI